MRIKKCGDNTQLWLSANDTWNWANRPGQAWPCSTVANRRLFIELDKNGDLVDYAVNGKSDYYVDGHELNCILQDFLGRDARSLTNR